jgi:hypothetical protein
MASSKQIEPRAHVAMRAALGKSAASTLGPAPPVRPRGTIPVTEGFAITPALDELWSRGFPSPWNDPGRWTTTAHFLGVTSLSLRERLPLARFLELTEPLAGTTHPALVSQGLRMAAVRDDALPAPEPRAVPFPLARRDTEALAAEIEANGFRSCCGWRTCSAQAGWVGGRRRARSPGCASWDGARRGCSRTRRARSRRSTIPRSHG